jgi:hypothetical protein
MTSLRRLGAWTLALSLSSLGAAARGDLIYESAASLRTGVYNSQAGGVETDASFDSGVNFFVSAPVIVQSIGGKFTPSPVAGNNEIFGAIVRVNGQFDTPDLATNLLGTTLITLPGNQDVEDVSGALSVTLTPGWYAVLFGTGRFGATGSAFAVIDFDGQPANTTGDVTYGVRKSDGALIPEAAGSRYFVLGTAAVPEPSSAALALLGLAGVGVARLRARRARSRA